MARNPDRLSILGARLSRDPHRPVAGVGDDARRADAASTRHGRGRLGRDGRSATGHRSDHSVDDERRVARSTNGLATGKRHRGTEHSGHNRDDDPDRHHDASVTLKPWRPARAVARRTTASPWRSEHWPGSPRGRSAVAPGALGAISEPSRHRSARPRITSSTPMRTARSVELVELNVSIHCDRASRCEPRDRRSKHPSSTSSASSRSSANDPDRIVVAPRPSAS